MLDKWIEQLNVICSQIGLEQGEEDYFMLSTDMFVIDCLIRKIVQETRLADDWDWDVMWRAYWDEVTPTHWFKAQHLFIGELI